MAVLKSNTFEGGADEDTITLANSDDGTSGDAFDSVVIGASVGFVYDTARAANGSVSLRTTQPATPATTYVAWTSLASLTAATYARFYLYLTQLPTADNLWLLDWRSSVQSTARVRINTTGFLELRNESGSSVTGVGDVQVAINQWVRIESRIIPSNAGSGELAFRLYNTASSTSIDDEVALTGRSDIGINTIGARFGAGTGDLGDPSVSFWMDDVALADTDWLGPSAGVSDASQRFMWMP